jgi:hypothetical protein
MTSIASNSELNLSKSKGGYPYWQEQLKVFWTEVQRSALYEYDTIHGVNCLCCSKIRFLQIGNDMKLKAKAKTGRKPGGHNQR